MVVMSAQMNRAWGTLHRARSICRAEASTPVTSNPGRLRDRCRADLQVPNAPHELARSRVWIRGDEPRIGVGRLDDPYGDDARVSAVRRYERATDREHLAKRIARLVGHRIVLRMVQQCAFEFSPIAPARNRRT
jgi:hypothetical protein